jgi:hypothetical protein
MKTVLALLVLEMAATIAQAQTPYVTITGNSIAFFQHPFAPDEFPSLPSDEVTIGGQDSEPCSYFNALDGQGQPLIYSYVPAQTTVAVLIDSTNDVRTNVSVSQHMQCIEQTIDYLLQRNSQLKIVVANTPPWTQYNPCTMQNNSGIYLQLIQAYNIAYANQDTGLQALYPNNVRVADVFTPAALPSGWANTDLMNGPCGIHPGPANVWTISWAHFTPAYDQLVIEAINGGW